MRFKTTILISIKNDFFPSRQEDDDCEFRIMAIKIVTNAIISRITVRDVFRSLSADTINDFYFLRLDGILSFIVYIVLYYTILMLCIIKRFQCSNRPVRGSRILSIIYRYKSIPKRLLRITIVLQVFRSQTPFTIVFTVGRYIIVYCSW